MGQKYLTFKRGQYLLAVLLSSVREIYTFDKIVPVPRSPKGLRGVVNYRGEIIPVFSIEEKIGDKLPECNLGVVLEKEGEKIGICVDSVLGVVEGEEFKKIETHQIFEGVISVKDARYYVIGLDKLLSGGKA